MLFNAQEWKNIFKDGFQGEVGFGVPMKDHTNLSIGGCADALAAPGDPLSLRNLIAILKREGVPFFTLGGGTNILVRDGGIEGVVVSLKAFNRIEVLEEEEQTVELFVEAGVPLQRLVNFCKDRGYSGIEGLTGIPGAVGGAIRGNAGSYGCEMKDVLVSLAIMDSGARLDRFKAEGLGFGYRKSDILRTDIVLSSNMRLRRDGREVVAGRTEDFFAEKKKSQPVSEKSAGCVFKNPEGESAGRLIDEAGCKGMRCGGIEVSALHANFFINRGGGNASDYLRLMDEVSAVVKKRSGIALEPEINIIGRE